VFTLGGLLYHLFQGEHPFPCGLYTPKYRRINNILYPANIHAIITRCLQENPDLRPTVIELEKEMAEGFAEVLRQFEFLSDSFITQWMPIRSSVSGDTETVAEASIVVSRWPAWDTDEQGLLIVELFDAISRGKSATVKELLLQGVSPMSRDTENQTPLHCAVISGNLEIVRLLFEHSIDVNCKIFCKFAFVLSEERDPKKVSLALGSHNFSELSADNIHSCWKMQENGSPSGCSSQSHSPNRVSN
jgi:serine/threonine protein kinase